MELLLSLKEIPDDLWKEFKSSVQVKLQIHTGCSNIFQ